MALLLHRDTLQSPWPSKSRCRATEHWFTLKTQPICGPASPQAPVRRRRRFVVPRIRPLRVRPWPCEETRREERMAVCNKARGRGSDGWLKETKMGLGTLVPADHAGIPATGSTPHHSRMHDQLTARPASVLLSDVVCANSPQRAGCRRR